MAQLIDGKLISQQIKDELKEEVAQFKAEGIDICLAVIQVGSDPASSVYVRNKKKRKDWIALISTDTSLSEEDIIRIYGKRWQTEVFYKTCKSWLKLGSECQSLSYDALTAHVAIVFTRYILVSLEQRCNADERTICELFYVLHDELADITYNESLCIIVEAMLESLRIAFNITEEQLEIFTVDFINRLPKYLQASLGCILAA